MRHHKLVEWDHKMKQMFDEIDDALEDKYGDMYHLHPNRPRRGTTANKEHDGLFNVGASFSAGYGSEHGRGYVLDVDMVTLEHVPDDVEEKINQEVVQMVKNKLPNYFPDRNLDVSRDGRVFKIYGDLSLGSL